MAVSLNVDLFGVVECESELTDQIQAVAPVSSVAQRALQEHNQNRRKSEEGGSFSFADTFKKRMRSIPALDLENQERTVEVELPPQAVLQSGSSVQLGSTTFFVKGHDSKISDIFSPVMSPNAVAMTEGGVNQSYFIMSGGEAKAIFKPAEGARGADGMETQAKWGIEPKWQPWLEVAGAFFASKLKVDAPVICMATLVDAEGKSHVGSLQLFIENSRTLDQIPPEELQAHLSKLDREDPEALQRFYALDLCILNTDRHSGNLLLGSNGKMHPIDQANLWPAGFLSAATFTWLDWEGKALHTPFVSNVVEDILKLNDQTVQKMIQNLPGEQLSVLQYCQRAMRVFIDEGLTPYQMAAPFISFSVEHLRHAYLSPMKLIFTNGPRFDETFDLRMHEMAQIIKTASGEALSVHEIADKLGEHFISKFGVSEFWETPQEEDIFEASQ